MKTSAHRVLLASAVMCSAAACDGWIDPLGETPEPGAEPGDESEIEPPDEVHPCETGTCWETTFNSATCGTAFAFENFATGLYNVHAYDAVLPGGGEHRIELAPTAGDWQPVILINRQDGTTLFDGAVGLASDEVTVRAIEAGGDDEAVVVVQAQRELDVIIYVTGWEVVASGYQSFLPQDASYQLSQQIECTGNSGGQGGGLLEPPNFDPDDVVNGYFLLPQSDPSGLYIRKEDGCSRGNKLLIDVIYTAATHWYQQQPSLAPLSIRDMNEGPCSTVNHETHNDGTHADIVQECATSVSCSDRRPAVELAKVLVDTGEICGILFNRTSVQDEVNAYFASKYSYAPWKGKFMRSVDGHVSHFHVRVKRPDGTCN